MTSAKKSKHIATCEVTPLHWWKQMPTQYIKKAIETNKKQITLNIHREFLLPLLLLASVIAIIRFFSLF